MSIKYKIGLYAILVSLLPMIFIGSTGYFKSVGLLNENQITIARQAIVRAEDQIIKTIEDTKKLATVMAGNIEQYGVEDGFHMFSTVSSNYPEYKYTYFGEAQSGKFLITPKTSLPADYDPRKRPWYSIATDEKAVVSKPYVDASTGQIMVTVSRAVFKDGQKIGVVGIDLDFSAISSRITNIKIGETGYIFVLYKDGTTLIHKDPKLIGKNLTDKLDFLKQMLDLKNGVLEYDFKGEKFSVVRTIDQYGWTIGGGTYYSEVRKPLHVLRNMIVGVGVVVLLVVLVGMFLVNRLIVLPIIQAADVTNAISVGDLSRHLNHEAHDELGALSRSLDRMIDSLDEKANLAEKIAAGDLTVTATVASEKDRLGKALQKMIANLNQLIQSVRQASGQIVSGTNQVSDSSQSLSQGATEQASSLEEITSSVTELSSQTKNNAENASQASNLAVESKGIAGKGNDHMQDMISAMSDISGSSKEIAKIIKAIDDIAFQTNLLALNAAVEAARAGKHGKGFAVVAQEVRTLAARSARAAQESTQLIDGAVRNVEKGTSIVNLTAEALDEIVEGTTKVADLVGEIAIASNEQAQGIAQINQGLAQVDHVTQSNAANAEETASAAETLSSQAHNLDSQLKQFTLQDQGAIADGRVSISSGHGAGPGYPASTAQIQPAAQALIPQEAPAAAPEIVKWSPALSVGIKKMDGEHRRLIELINKLYRGLKAGSAQAVIQDVLSELVEYTQTHFSSEEAMLRVRKYPQFDAHKKIHDQFIEKVSALVERFDHGSSVGVETLQFLKEWLVDHIQKMDRQYGAYLNRH